MFIKFFNRFRKPIVFKSEFEPDVSYRKFKYQSNIDYFLSGEDNNAIELNFKIYTELIEDPRWENTIEPLELFNLIHKKIEYMYLYCAKPNKYVKHLTSLPLSSKQMLCFLYFFIKLGEGRLGCSYDDIDKINDDGEEWNYINQLLATLNLIKIEYNKLDQKLKHEKYNFNNVLDHIKPLSYSHKIAYLIEQKSVYQQDDDKPKNIGNISFENRCNIEIEKLKTLAEFDEKSTSTTQPKLKLSSKKGTKTNLIRVLHTLYEMRYFETSDGQIPTKLEFMEVMGEYFDTNFSDYARNLSQSLQNQPLEANTKVFMEMISIIEKEHFTNK
ncbi:MAG: hypothetical protein GY827_08965 [Cytophagales bacterium]|nr:hypothetical protein [Cytophagales bacterium]